MIFSKVYDINEVVHHQKVASHYIEASVEASEHRNNRKMKVSYPRFLFLEKEKRMGKK